VGSEDKRYLSTVVKLVLHEVPDHPLTGEGLSAGDALTTELDGEVVRCPSPEAVIARA
jgi:hypothetical protein